MPAFTFESALSAGGGVPSFAHSAASPASVVVEVAVVLAGAGACRAHPSAPAATSKVATVMVRVIILMQSSWES
jgi:hypothetical protein